jgi:hypothetical protein
MITNVQKHLFLILMSVIIFSGSCTKEVIGFDMTYKRDFVVKGGLSPSQGHYFVMNDFSANFTGFAQAKGSDITKVQQIVPKSMRITSRFPDATFDAVRSVEVRVSKGSFDTGTEVFYYPAPVPTNRNYLDLSPGLADVKDLLGNDGKFNIIVRLDFLYSPPKEIEVVSEIAFKAVTN